MVQHLQMWDYICLSQTKENRIIEYVDQQHEHFEDPVCVKNACYMPPTLPGYSTKIKDECILENAYPCGKKWRLERLMNIDDCTDNSESSEEFTLEDLRAK